MYVCKSDLELHHYLLLNGVVKYLKNVYRPRIEFTPSYNCPHFDSNGVVDSRITQQYIIFC